jgi:hypothetical protein
MRKKLTEETIIKNQLKSYLDYCGFFRYHNMAGMGCYSGLSDMVIIKNGIVIFVEVKKIKGVQSENQIEFEKKIINAGGNYVIVHSVEELDKYLSEKHGFKSMMLFY